MFLGLLEFSIAILLCLSGVPVAMALGVVGLVAAWFFYGGIAGAYLAGITAWTNMNSWSMTMLPLFIFMGSLAALSGLGRDAFDCFFKWLSRMRGSVAIVATITSAFFGAITGSTAATIATIGSISIPEMKRLGYSTSLRMGSVTVAGILANLIPPSIFAIIYCTIASVSVGKVFIAGLIPGVILTILFVITIFIWGRVKPSIAPAPVETYSLKDKLLSLKLPLPIILIFVLMIGGIYFGIFTPTEAAGIGAILMLILVSAMRRLSGAKFIAALRDTVRITAFIMLLIMGAMLFGHTIALSGFPDTFTKMVVGLGFPPVGLMFAIIFAIVLLGCVLEALTLLVLITPLFLPAVIGLGFDPIWFGTMMVILVELACITPPIAPNIWIAQSVEPTSTIGEVTRGVVPFYAAAVLLLTLLVFFPQVALWLPSRMY